MHVAPLGHLDCFRRRSQNFVRLSFRSRETVRRATEEMGIMWWEQLGLRAHSAASPKTYKTYKTYPSEVLSPMF